MLICIFPERKREKPANERVWGVASREEREQKHHRYQHLYRPESDEAVDHLQDPQS